MALNFKLKKGKDLTPGCRYVVVTWFDNSGLRKGSSKLRAVNSCHRTAKAARTAAAALRKRQDPGWFKRVGLYRTWGMPQAAAYDTKTGKRLK